MPGALLHAAVAADRTARDGQPQRSSTRPSLRTGLPSSFSDSKPRAPSSSPDPRRHRFAREQRCREADRDPPHRPRVVDARGLQNRPSRERHRAEPVHDSAREPDLPCEPVVEVNREVVSGGSGVPDRLVVGDGVCHLRQRRFPGDLEAVIGCPLTDAFLGRDSAEELGDVLLVHELAVAVARLGLDHERRPVRAREERDGRRSGEERRSGSYGAMQHHVLLVVDDEASDVARCNRAATPARSCARPGRSRTRALPERRRSPRRRLASPPR